MGTSRPETVLAAIPATASDVRENRPDRHRCDIQPSPRQQRGSWALSGKTAFKIGDEITVGGPGTCAFMPRRRADA